MNRLAISALIASLACLASVPAARPAAAQTPPGDLDHLVCYPMKDPLPGPASFNLLARLQPEFSRRGCRIALGRDQTVDSQFCVPAAKVDVEAPQHDDLDGPLLTSDYVCYRIECPLAAAPPAKTITDQFGRRNVRFGQPFKLCVPAIKERIPCSGLATTVGGAPVCGGLCPDAGDRCRLLKGTNECACAPQECKGTADAAGVCGGGCPEVGDRCVRDANNRCRCEPPPPCGVDPDSGMCGGTCADGQECRPAAATTAACTCQPATQPCGLNPTSGQCAGECPDSNDVCRHNVQTGDCGCLPFGGLD